MFALNGKLDSAIASYSIALELKPDFAASIWGLGNMYMFTQEYAKAESLYQTLASDSDKITRANGRLYLTQIPLHQGKFEEGLRMLNELRDSALADSLSGYYQSYGTFKRAYLYQYVFKTMS
ncbi:MAG: tetratricopeptide repeat protein [candidate division Zixibacteria bacterium]|nr:tetratricopeptide repeat protein [candidate division Zixibacteria bacterium]